MTADRIGGLLAVSAEKAEEKLDRLAEKLKALGGGKGIRLELDTSQAEERLSGALRDYDSAIDKLKALKAQSRISYEQELAYLTAIREHMDAYSMRAGDVLDLEKRLLAVQKQINKRDTRSLDTLLSGITEALANRYKSMRDAELTMLTESRGAWRMWKESSTDAIQAQIDALDQLTAAEDRAAEKETHLRRIDKLSQALQYEQDAFNRGQLSAQLRDAQAAYEDWQRDAAREDEKAALRAQQNAVNERAQAEFDALDQQAEAVRAAYASQLQNVALQAEAQQQLMSGTQEEIIGLITAFAPEYNAAGQTLGEQMLAGFAEKAGSVSAWMESLNGLIAGVQQSMNAALQPAAESFYGQHSTGGITITQQNTFNTPVESPSETAWRIRQANEALAAELLES